MLGNQARGRGNQACGRVEGDAWDRQKLKSDNFRMEDVAFYGSLVVYFLR